eukprot:IDg8198t1
MTTRKGASESAAKAAVKKPPPPTPSIPLMKPMVVPAHASAPVRGGSDSRVERCSSRRARKGTDGASDMQTMANARRSTAWSTRRDNIAPTGDAAAAARESMPAILISTASAAAYDAALVKAMQDTAISELPAATVCGTPAKRTRPGITKREPPTPAQAPRVPAPNPTAPAVTAVRVVGRGCGVLLFAALLLQRLGGAGRRWCRRPRRRARVNMVFLWGVVGLLVGGVFHWPLALIFFLHRENMGDALSYHTGMIPVRLSTGRPRKGVAYGV